MTLKDTPIKKIKWPADLIKNNIAYVYKQAFKYSTYHHKAEVDDLVQEGCVVLLKAWATFDETLGVKFLTHAAWWIKAYMFKYLETKIHLIYVPCYLRQNKAGHNKRQLTDELQSFEKIVGSNPDGDLKLEDMLSDNGQEAITVEEREHVWTLLSYLEESHCERLKRYFGLDQPEPLTLRELGKVEGKCYESVRQNIEQSVKKLRGYLNRERLRVNSK